MIYLHACSDQHCGYRSHTTISCTFGMALAYIVRALLDAASLPVAKAPGVAQKLPIDSMAAKLTARPSAFRLEKSSTPLASHAHRLKLGDTRDGYLYVPATYDPDVPSPLIVMLHGAGGTGESCLRTFGDPSNLDKQRCLLLAPESRASTWDVIRGGFGPDVRFIDKALSKVFGSYRVDPSRLAIAGFSDGASYALSLGLPNGDLFSHIIAFSPGFMRAPTKEGHPQVYISHGTQDAVLPVSCARRVVQQLRSMGIAPEYHEFNGPHTVPANIAREALEWFADAK